MNSLFNYIKNSLLRVKSNHVNEQILSINTIISGFAGCGKTFLLENVLLKVAKQKKSFLFISCWQVMSNINEVLDITKNVYFFFYGNSNTKNSHSLELKDILSNSNFIRNTALKAWEPTKQDEFLNLWTKLIPSITQWEAFVDDCASCKGFTSLGDEENIALNIHLKSLHIFWYSIKNLMSEGILKVNADVGLKNINQEDIKIIYPLESKQIMNLEKHILYEALLSLYETRLSGVVAIDEYDFLPRLAKPQIIYLVSSYEPKKFDNLMGINDFQYVIMNQHGLQYGEYKAYEFGTLESGCFIVLNKEFHVVNSSFSETKYPAIEKVTNYPKDYYVQFLNSKKNISLKFSKNLENLLAPKESFKEKKLKL